MIIGWIWKMIHNFQTEVPNFFFIFFLILMDDYFLLILIYVKLNNQKKIVEISVNYVLINHIFSNFSFPFTTSSTTSLLTISAPRSFESALSSYDSKFIDYHREPPYSSCSSSQGRSIGITIPAIRATFLDKNDRFAPLQGPLLIGTRSNRENRRARGNAPSRLA